MMRPSPSTSEFRSFWALFDKGLWEPAGLTCMRLWAGPEERLLDIGAWIGPYSTLAAECGAVVHAYEPDPVAAAELRRNCASYDQITIHEVAILRRPGRAWLSPTGNLGNSMTRIVQGLTSFWEVPTLSLRKAIEDFRPTIIKMDVEGGEFELVQDLEFGTYWWPKVHISVHPKLGNEEALVSKLKSSFDRIESLDRSPESYSLACWNRSR